MKSKTAIIKQKCPSCECMVNGLDPTFNVCKDCLDLMDRDDSPTWRLRLMV